MLKFRCYDSDDSQMIERGIEEVQELFDMGYTQYEFMKYSGYKMFDVDVWQNDFVSNNHKTENAVIREVIESPNGWVMRVVSGENKTKMPKDISLHDFHLMNFRVIGNRKQTDIPF